MRHQREAEAARAARRDRLTALDGLLFRVEEWNLEHDADELLPAALVRQYQRLLGERRWHGVATGPAMVDAIFALQEELLVRPAPADRVSRSRPLRPWDDPRP